MIPFDVKVGGQRVSISFESLVWFFIVTAGATVLGELVYDKWVQPYLSSLPSLPNALLPSASVTPTATPPASTVVSTQTPRQQWRAQNNAAS